MIKKFFLTFLISLFLFNPLYSKENFFEKAKKLFDEEKYEESKFLFQNFWQIQFENYTYLHHILVSLN